MKTTDTWRPIVDGALADRLREAILDVAEALRDPAKVVGLPNAGLSGGFASMSIFYYYLAKAFPGPGWEWVAEAYLERAIDCVASERMDPSLYSGFIGIAWALEHMVGRYADAREPDANGSIDESLESFLEETPWRTSYDLVVGLVGYGTYGLERLPRPSGARCVAHVVDRLFETARRIPGDDGEQITWWTDPSWLPAESARRYPGGEYNLGVAHGVPGTIPILAAACRAGIAVDRARPLLEGAMRWLLASRLPDGDVGRYDYVREPMSTSRARHPARAAWCCGDPGIAAALLAAARAVRNGPWERDAIELGLLAARRPVTESQVVDTGICHGSAGLAHVFNRLHHETGKVDFADAARMWLERTLELRRPGAAVAGFPSFQNQPQPSWAADPGLLCGAAGVALVMISAITPVTPAWDRMLLCSLPPLARVRSV